MKKQSTVITIFGILSIFSGITTLITSSITFHPSILVMAKKLMILAFLLWIISVLITFIMSLFTVALADDQELDSAKSLRRVGLWYSLPQIAIILFLLLGGLLLARDIAAMGGH